MSGSEEIKKRLKETFRNSPMPDFEEERNCKPSPLKPLEENFNSQQQTKAIICPNCSGEGKDMRNGSKHCEYCDFWW